MGEEKVLGTISVPQGSSGREIRPAEALLWGHRNPKGEEAHSFPRCGTRCRTATLWWIRDAASAGSAPAHWCWLSPESSSLALSLVGCICGENHRIPSRRPPFPPLLYSAALSAPRGDPVVGLPRCPDWGRREEEGAIPMN